MMIRRSLFVGALTSVILAVTGCDSDEATGQRTGTVFSCDNPTLTSSGAAPCFSPDDPNYMTVALRRKPAGMSGNLLRLNDDGDGLPAVILSQRNLFGTTWYEVQIGNRTGWIAEHFVRLNTSR